MSARKSWTSPVSWRMPRRFSVETIAVVAVVMGLTGFAVGRCLPAFESVFEQHAVLFGEAAIVVGVALLAAAATQALASYKAVHRLANLTAWEAPKPLRSVRVIDGDTIEDRADGVRYRLANIDAPETGVRAKCFRERRAGECAAETSAALVGAAHLVSVRRTWRTDSYGRRIAFVLIDGEDLGQALMVRGVARPWRGRRVQWCGSRGGLAAIARGRGEIFDCGACRGWR